MEWMDELTRLAKDDPWYQECLADVRRKETAFVKLRDALPQAQQQELDAYIAACEELEHALLPIAYRIGLTHALL